MRHSGGIAARGMRAVVDHLLQRQRTMQRRCRAARVRLQRQLHTISAQLQTLPRASSPAATQQRTAAQSALRAAVAFLAAVCLHLGTASTSDAIQLSSAAEDTLLGLVRTLEAKVDGAITAVVSGAAAAVAPGSPAARKEERQAARDLINEIHDVVAQNFADARAAGFDPGRWARLRDAALARAPGDRGAAYSAVRGMLAELHDPYSRFITPQEFQGMLKYDVSGVGLNLGTLEELRAKTGLGPPLSGDDSGSSSTSGSSNGGVWVVGLVRGAAADTAGLRQGDELLEADGAALAAHSPFEVASLLQGQEAPESFGVLGVGGDGGSQPAVRLTVRHLDGSTEAVTLHRPPRQAAPSPVTSRLEKRTSAGSVGYMRLRSFDARAQRDVAAAVRRLRDEGAQRFTLDLRGNRGGLVTEGIEVARLFLDGEARDHFVALQNRCCSSRPTACKFLLLRQPFMCVLVLLRPTYPMLTNHASPVSLCLSVCSGDATIVRAQGRARATAAPPTAPGPALTTAPLAVLVDGHTASASEILAGALRDNCRAVLVGERTYGKGLIQSVYELGDGSGLVLTVGKYLTPAGTDIDLEGIKPDFRAAPSAEAAESALAACRLKSRLGEAAHL